MEDKKYKPSDSPRVLNIDELVKMSQRQLNRDVYNTASIFLSPPISKIFFYRK